MVELNDVNLTKWEKKRSKTLVVYTLQNILNGIVFSVLDVTSWFYVTTLMEVNTTNLIYGLLCAMVYISPLMFITPVSKWLAKTREVKKLLIAFNIANLIACALYVLPFSPYYAILARFFYGFNIIVRTVITSEVFHSYTDKELQQKLTSMAIGVFFGGAIGSVTSFMFSKVDFWIGFLHITYGNICSVPIFILTNIQLLLIIVISYDVSNEYDIKTSDMGLTNSMLNKYRQSDSDCSNNDRKNTTKFDYIFLLCLAFYYGIWVQLPIHLLPLVIERLGYPKEVVSILFLGYSILNIITMLVIERIKFSNNAVNGISSILFLVLVATCLYATNTNHHVATNSIILGLMVVSECLFNLVDRVIIVVTTAKMLYISNHASGECWRLLVYFIGRVLGSFSAPYMYEDFNYVYFGHLVICFVCVVIILIRKSTLVDPRPLR